MLSLFDSGAYIMPVNRVVFDFSPGRSDLPSASRILFFHGVFFFKGY